jgi:hypothetical protein
MWLYLEKPVPPNIDANYDLKSLKEVEDLQLITLYVEIYLIHHTKENKSAKEIWDTFKILKPDLIHHTKDNKSEK